MRTARASGAVVLLAALLFALVPAGTASALDGSEPITTVAGTGPAGFAGDGFSATKALLRFPLAVAVDGSGSIYIAENANNRVRKVDGAGVISTVAGNGTTGYSGDGGPATQAGISAPVGVAVDGAGNLYIASYQDARVRKVDPSGVITTVAGDGSYGSGGDGGPATAAPVAPCTVIVDGNGDLYIGDCGTWTVRRVDAATGVITTLAGNGAGPFDCEPTEAVPATQTSVDPDGLAVGADGSVYIAEFLCNRVRKVDPAGSITTLAGTGGFCCEFGGDGGPATEAQLASPSDVDVDSSGNVYIADLSNGRVRKVDTAGIITTLAGDGSYDFGGDFGPASQAMFAGPWGLALDRAGSLYITDTSNNRLRRVGPDRLFLSESHAPDHATLADQITHTFTIRNLADSTSTGVKLTDTLSSDAAFVKADPRCSRSVRTVTCDVGSIAPGAIATMKVTVKALRSGALTNTATVSSRQAEPYAPTNTVVTPTLVSGSGCGQVITRSTVLGTDVGPCAGNGIVIGADNVTLDLKGHRIYGFPGPSGPAGDAAGVLLAGRTGATVKNGTVTGFDAGVVIRHGSSNTLTKLTITDNVGPDDAFNAQFGDGIFIQASDHNHVIANTIARNGIFDGIGIYEPGADFNTVENNVIRDTVGPSDGGPAGQGIIVNGALGGETTLIRSTRVADNVVRDNASAGSANVNHVGGSIVGNTVEGNGRTNSIGNGIGVSVGFNWDKGPTGMLIEGNEVHGNGVDGIRIGNAFGFGTGNPTGNEIRDNDAANNATNPDVNTYEGGIQGFDLHDLNADCDSNTWFGNIWGDAGYDPACAATGGSQSPAMTSAAPAPTATIPLAGRWKQARGWRSFAERGR